MRAPKFFFAGLVFSCCFAYGQEFDAGQTLAYAL